MAELPDRFKSRAAGARARRLSAVGRIVGVTGLCIALLLAFAWAMSYACPPLVVRIARDFVRVEIEKRVSEPLGELTDERIGQLARKQLDHVQERLAHVQERLAIASAPDPLAHARATPGPDCEVKPVECEAQERLAAMLGQPNAARLDSLARERAALGDRIQSGYGSVATHLLRECRILTASSMVLFVVAGILAIRGRSGRGVWAASVLIGAGTLAAVLYLFNQDWLHTLVYADYVESAYPWWLLVTALLFLELLVNRARIVLGGLRLVADWVEAAVPG